MAEKPKTKTVKKQPQVMDVSKPGKTAPSASSRPIIVGHKPVVQDSMVNEEKEEMPSIESEEHKITVNRAGPKVITPLSDTEDLPEANDSDPKADEPTEPEASVEHQDEAMSDTEAEDVDLPEVTPEEPADTEEEISEPAEDETTGKKESKAPKESKDKGSSIVDAVVGQVTKSKDKKDDKKTEELQKRLSEVEKLIEEKKYFVHTSNTSKKDRKTRWIVLLLSVLLLAGAYLAFDAQLIPNDFKLPYEFFKEQKESTASTPVAKINEDKKDTVADTEAYKVPEGYLLYENKQQGFSFVYPKTWNVELRDMTGCPAMSYDFDDGTEVAKCPQQGTVWFGDKNDANNGANILLFTSSTKTLDQLYTLHSVSFGGPDGTAKTERYESNGLKGYFINQGLVETNNVSSDNIYLTQLAAGEYFWLNHREYVPEGSVAGVKKDFRKYTSEIDKLVKSLKLLK